MADIFNKAAETCKKSGIQFCYHNHDFEFQVQNGVFPYDIILEKTDKNNVKMEVDLYWIKKAGQDPLALFQEEERKARKFKEARLKRKEAVDEREQKRMEGIAAVAK